MTVKKNTKTDQNQHQGKAESNQTDPKSLDRINELLNAIVLADRKGLAAIREGLAARLDAGKALFGFQRKNPDKKWGVWLSSNLPNLNRETADKHISLYKLIHGKNMVTVTTFIEKTAKKLYEGALIYRNLYDCGSIEALPRLEAERAEHQRTKAERRTAKLVDRVLNSSHKPNSTSNPEQACPNHNKKHVPDQNDIASAKSSTPAEGLIPITFQLTPEQRQRFTKGMRQGESTSDYIMRMVGILEAAEATQPQVEAKNQPEETPRQEVSKAPTPEPPADQEDTESMAAPSTKKGRAELKSIREVARKAGCLGGKVTIEGKEYEIPPARPKTEMEQFDLFGHKYESRKEYLFRARVGTFDGKLAWLEDVSDESGRDVSGQENSNCKVPLKSEKWKAGEEKILRKSKAPIEFRAQVIYDKDDNPILTKPRAMKRVEESAK